ncbi:MAG: hypothetical protein V1789_02210 [PVC group bacterium]
MAVIFDKITLFFSLVLYPFRGLPPLIGLAFLSLGAAVFALLVYKYVSNQAAIRARKKRIIGHFFGIYLFRDDLGQILREFARVLGSIFRYLGHVLLPLLIVMVPVVLLCVQIQLRYGYRSLRPGEEANVTVELLPSVDLLLTKIELAAPAGVSIQTPPLRIPALQETVWRVRVLEEGNYVLTLAAGEAVLKKELKAGRRIGRIYPVTGRGSFWYVLTSPGGEDIPAASPFLRARIDYPDREISLGVARMHWSIVFLILTLGFGLILKKPLKVDF